MRPIPGTVTEYGMHRLLYRQTGGVQAVSLLHLAEALAKVVHAGQRRKGTGEPYFNHLTRVAFRVESIREKTIAFLHDTIEDTPVAYGVLAAIGFPNDIIVDVLALTRKEGETYQDFTARTIKTGSDDALRVKLSDLQDNLDSVPDSLRGRYTQATLQVKNALLERRGHTAADVA